MTGKLVEIFRTMVVAIVRSPGKNKRPGPRVHVRILDRNGVIDRVRVDFREALGESHVALRETLPAITVQPGRTEPLLVAEVGRVDHQRIALPAPARTPTPPPDGGSRIRPAIPGDDS